MRSAGAMEPAIRKPRLTMQTAAFREVTPREGVLNCLFGALQEASTLE